MKPAIRCMRCGRYVHEDLVGGLCASCVGKIEVVTAAREAYKPLTGEGYSITGAAAAWLESMTRTGMEWKLTGGPGNWVWVHWYFGPRQGFVRIREDGIHWESRSYDNPDEIIAQGMTTSLYEAYQSVIQGRTVKWEGGEPDGT